MPQPSEGHPPMLILALSAALIALTVSYSVDAEPLTTAATFQPAALATPSFPAYEPPTLAPSAIVLKVESAYRLEQGRVKFYFAPSKTELTPIADHALHELSAAIQQGKRVQIAGFHDETGNAAQNIALSKQRAEAVRKRLIKLGASAKSIDVLRPAVGSANGDHSEARRVEVALLP